MTVEEFTMGGDTRFNILACGKSRNLAIALICLSALAGGCSKSEPEKKADADTTVAAGKKAEADTGVFDTSKLPRVAGAKQVFASPASTIFTSPDPVAQTAAALDKVLADAGW